MVQGRGAAGGHAERLRVGRKRSGKGVVASSLFAVATRFPLLGTEIEVNWRGLPIGWQPGRPGGLGER